ncbi:MAG TPA: PHB depolymerase family esterase [Pirellulales bacterium]
MTTICNRFWIRGTLLAALCAGLATANDAPPSETSTAATLPAQLQSETLVQDKSKDDADEKPNDAKPEAAPANPSNGQGGKSGVFGHVEVAVNGVERAYRLVVPKSLDLNKPAPLVFAYHGLGDSKDWMPWHSKLSKLADEKGFILVYPNARYRFWPLLPQIAQDDLKFFDAMYDAITKQYNIDLNRVHVVGMSNGGYFSHLLASERNGKIASIVCHSGGLGQYTFQAIDVAQKYSVLVIHGAVDTVVNVTEGRRVRDFYTKWGHPVEYIEIPGWNHYWAAKKNDAIWDFLQKHPLAPAAKNGA